MLQVLVVVELGKEGAGVAATPHGKVMGVAKWAHNEIFEMGNFWFAGLNTFLITEPNERKFNKLWWLFCSLWILLEAAIVIKSPRTQNHIYATDCNRNDYDDDDDDNVQ